MHLSDRATSISTAQKRSRMSRSPKPSSGHYLSQQIQYIISGYRGQLRQTAFPRLPPGSIGTMRRLPDPEPHGTARKTKPRRIGNRGSRKGTSFNFFAASGKKIKCMVPSPLPSPSSPAFRTPIFPPLNRLYPLDKKEKQSSMVGDRIDQNSFGAGGM